MGYFIKQTSGITYNSTNGTMTYNNGTDVVELAKTGSAQPVIDTLLTAAASAGPYTMTVDYTLDPYDLYPPASPEELIMVFIDGVHQSSATAYTVSADEITFTSVPPDGLTITIIHGAYSTDVSSTDIFNGV